VSEVARRLPHLGGRGEYEVVGSHSGYTAVSLELLSAPATVATTHRFCRVAAKPSADHRGQHHGVGGTRRTPPPPRLCGI